MSLKTNYYFSLNVTFPLKHYNTAINVDGKVYSFEGDGKWRVYTLDAYLKNDSQVRSYIDQTVNVDQTKIQDALDNRQDGAYNITTNSCVSNTIKVLEAGGISFNKPNGAVSPEQLSNALQNSGLVTNSTRTVSLKSATVTGLLIYKTIEWLTNKGLINPIGVRINTVPLISGQQ
jgi:hypothetical protein